MNLDTQRKQALAQAWRDCSGPGICGRAVDLHRVIDGKVAFVGEVILGENKRPVNGPAKHLETDAGGACVVELFKAAAMHVEKQAAYLAVWIVVPRGWIGRGTGKDSGDSVRR